MKSQHKLLRKSRDSSVESNLVSKRSYLEKVIHQVLHEKTVIFEYFFSKGLDFHGG